PYMGARTQFRPNAAATARSASTPSGRTKTARAFRQRSSRPMVWRSRTPSDPFTIRIVVPGPRIGECSPQFPERRPDRAERDPGLAAEPDVEVLVRHQIGVLAAAGELDRLEQTFEPFAIIVEDDQHRR